MDGIRDLESKLAEWAGAGLITGDQTARILQHERGEAEDRPRSSAIAEVLGYLGGALALIAAIVLAAEFWTDLEVGARLGIVGATAALFALAGWLLRKNASPLILRLSDFLFVLATVGLAFFVGILASDAAGMSEGASASLATVAAAVTSSLLWRWRRSAVRHFALFASLFATVLALMSNLDDLESFYFGLGVATLGLAWGAITWSGAIEPRTMGLALGSSAMVLGAVIGSFSDLTATSALLGLGTAAGLVTAGVMLSSVFVLAAGTVAVFLVVPRVIFESFGDTAGGAAALLISGLVLVAAAVGVNRLGRRVVQASRHKAAKRTHGAMNPARQRTVVVMAVALVVAVAAVVVVIGYTPRPSFPSVADSGVDLPGTIAFQRWDRDESCIYTIPASGGSESLVACAPEFGQPMAWTADGDLAVMTYGAERFALTVLDPATGDVVSTHDATGYEQRMYEIDQQSREVGGMLVNDVEARGATIAIQMPGGTTRTIVSVGGSRNYGFWDLRWSPDGEWIVAVDSGSRIVLVSGDGSVGPLLLVGDGSTPTWNIPGDTTYTIDIPAAG